MKIFTYIRYFFYVAINWGFRIAVVIIAQEIKGEKKYGINTTGADELGTLKKSGVDISHATVYMPVSYPLLEKCIEQIGPNDRNHFLDIGAGKGRALCVAAHYGFHEVTGVEFSKEFCHSSAKNLAAIRPDFPYLKAAVVNADATQYEIPCTVDCIFLFNPFDEVIMKKVVANIQKSLQLCPRSINIIYANPLYKQLFEKVGFKQVYYSKTLKQFEVTILNCRPV